MSGPAGLVIRSVTDDADLEVLAGIVNATTPEDPTTLDEIHWSDATYPGSTRFIAPMRALNARLGYQPMADEIAMRGPLFDGMMTG